MKKKALLLLTSLVVLFSVAALTQAAETAAPAPAGAPAAPAPAAPPPPPPAGAQVGDILPDFSLPSDTGTTFTRESLKGKKAIITFMQTACSACKGEIVFLNGLASKYPDVQIFPVSVDLRGAEAVKRFKADYQIKFDFLMDPEYKFPREFGFSFTPATVLVGKDGKITALVSGYNDATEDRLEDFMKK